ncbi:MAG: hypothetical protein ACOYOU_20025 [Kiritimatiellia bacterium]
MSAGSNRALYTAGATNHGRALYSPDTFRAIYAAPAIVSPSFRDKFYGSASYSTWDETTYRASISDAIAAAAADTSLDTDNNSLYRGGTMTRAYMHHGYGFVVGGLCNIRRDRFILPAGVSMANIKRVILTANIGGGQASHVFSGNYDKWGYRIYTDTCVFNDFGASLNIVLSQSATEFASGSAVRAATPDSSFAISDINDAHAAASRAITWYGDPAYGMYLLPPRMSMEREALIDKINGFTDNTYFYMWSWFSGETLDYLFDHLGANDSFICGLRFYDPTLWCMEN